MKNYWMQQLGAIDISDEILDFNDIIGDTLKEKFESIYVALVDLARRVHQGVPDVHMGWEVSTLFETSCAGFYPAESSYNANFYRLHQYNHRFTIWVDRNLPGNFIMVRGEDGDWYRIIIKNYYI